MSARAAPWGVVLLATFLATATVILVAAGLALLLPGSAMEVVWLVYPARRAILMPYRVWLGPGFLGLAVLMAAASVGCVQRRRWGWRLAVTIFAVNGLSDAAQVIFGRVVEGGIGVVVAGAVLFYLMRANVRAEYRP